MKQEGEKLSTEQAREVLYFASTRNCPKSDKGQLNSFTKLNHDTIITFQNLNL